MRTLLVVFVLAFIGAALAQNSCTLDDYKRVDCGGSSQSNCNQKGCCWVPAYSGSAIPWCFYGANHTQSVPIPPPALPGAPFTSANVNTMFQYFLANINIDGLGGVVASPDNSTPGGSYYYHWERDGALSMNALQLVSSFSTSLPLMQSYVKWVLNVQSEPDPNGIDVRVEPKYNLPYGDVYSGSWCRPQTDGPGLRAITLITFANNMLAQSSSTYMSYVKQYLWTGNQNSYHGGAIKYDLDWIVSNWAQNGCDLWEEIQSTDFFWNRFTMKAALFLGSTFAQSMGDSQSSSTYLSVAQQINATLGNHWNGNFVFESSNRKEDSAVILAFNNGYSNDGYFAPNSEYVTGTVNTLNYMFYTAYPINFHDSSNGVPGILYGRYQGDTYAGGNPWILTTCSLAQLFYRGATAVINNAELPNLNAIRHYQEIFSTLLRSTHQVDDLVKLKPLDFARLVASAGDAVLNRINYHVKGAGFHLAEQLDKNTGIEISATDLTWSYATALKAMWYRDNFSNVVQSVHRGDKSIRNDPFFMPVHWKN